MGSPDKSLYIGLDPSLRAAGLAMALEKEAIQVFRITSDAPGAYQTRALSMTSMILSVIEQTVDEMDPTHSTTRRLLCECPQHFDSIKGHASEQSESVQRLYMTVGAILQLSVLSQSIDMVSIVTPMKWKGQTDKQVMIRRAMGWVERHYGHRVPKGAMKDDEAEASLLVRYLQRNLGKPDTYTTIKRSSRDRWLKTVDVDLVV